MKLAGCEQHILSCANRGANFGQSTNGNFRPGTSGLDNGTLPGSIWYQNRAKEQTWMQNDTNATSWRAIERQIDSLGIQKQIEYLRSQLADEWHFRLSRRANADSPMDPGVFDASQS
jgi:hypothetical protein